MKMLIAASKSIPKADKQPRSAIRLLEKLSTAFPREPSMIFAGPSTRLRAR
jgi:hypothetical protein